MVIRSVVLPVSTNTLLTFICPNLRVTTSGSVCGCCSSWEVVVLNLMIGPLDMVFEGPLSRVWTLSLAGADCRVFLDVVAEIILMVPCVLELSRLASSLLGICVFRFKASFPLRLLCHSPSG